VPSTLYSKVYKCSLSLPALSSHLLDQQSLLRSLYLKDEGYGSSLKPSVYQYMALSVYPMEPMEELKLMKRRVLESY
jgi:hypothetical protein